MVFGSLYNKELMLWAVVLEKTLESCLDCKEIKPVKEISPEYSLEAEAETPELRLPDVKNWLTGKDPDPGKD